ncbi:MAG: hypothetical protein ABIC91_01370 [Nanoarchaeota archaeon]|nr:hypothetical protein [Nanoarchaeota archaeon]MBU1029869.1 hypothetical protein [Nanoarchaeota archaeon]MBU1849281.1 hypothetical protein [Nanoarchaeota archaeon]
MNKKGLMLSKSVNLFLYGAIFIILVIIVGMIIINLTKGNSREDCRLSMLMKTATTVEVAGGFAGVNSPISDSCPRYFVKFSKTKAEIRKGTKAFDTVKYDKLTKDNELTNDIVNKLVAEELRGCWYQFGAGKMDAFWIPSKLYLINDWSNNEKVCFICSEIEFEKQDFNSINYDGFYDYLQEHDILGTTKQGDGETLYSYLTTTDFCQDKYLAAGINCWEAYASEENINLQLKFNSDERYYVVLIRHGEDKDDATINSYVIPTSDYRQYCNQQAK